MLIDKALEMSDAQAIVDTGVSENVCDLGAAGDAKGCNAMYWKVIVAAAVVRAAGACTVTFKLQTATDAAFSSPVDLIVSGAISKTVLTAGATAVYAKLPESGLLRYIRTSYTFSAAADSGAKFDSVMVINE